MSPSPQTFMLTSQGNYDNCGSNFPSIQQHVMSPPIVLSGESYNPVPYNSNGQTTFNVQYTSQPLYYR